MYETALVINDCHIPFHDPKAIQLALQVAEDAKVHRIFINGDLLDCWELSRYHKQHKLYPQANIKKELAQGRAFLHSLRARFSGPIHYIFGNHEFRWEAHISAKAQELAGLRGLSLAEQLDCAALNITVVDNGTKENKFRWGKFVIGHFDRVNSHSGYTAKALVDSKGVSGIQGHTHRGGSSFKRLDDRDIVFYENFCLCDRNPQYTDHPNWQLGFSLVHKDSESDFFYVEPKPIVETEKKGRRQYRCFHNGKCYTTTAFTRPA